MKSLYATIILVFLAFVTGSCSSRAEQPPPPEKPFLPAPSPAPTPTPWSAAKPFPAPELISPADGATLDNGRIADSYDGMVWAFDWSDVPGANSYELCIIPPAPLAYTVRHEIITASRYEKRSEWGAYLPDKYRFGWKWKVRAAYVPSSPPNPAWGEWSELRAFDVEPPDTDPPPASPSPRVARPTTTPVPAAPS